MQNSFARLCFWLLICGSGAIIAGLSSFYLYLSPKLPPVDSLRHVKLQTPLRIYSNDGMLLGEFGEKRRTPIQSKDIPKHYINALLSAEDDQFYSHNGVSLKGLMRAMSQLISTGHIKSGGSTITMQVARNFFLTRQQTFARKFNEILLALQIERELNKNEILELYVNVIFLGNRAYGINAAADTYYGKPIDQLSLAQLAMIAGLPKAPSTFNPVANPERALIRRNWILGRMLSLGHIDQEKYNNAKLEPVTASLHGIKVDYHAPYIAEMARRKVLDLYGPSAYTDGLKAYTTVDSQLQRRAQQSVAKGLLAYDKRKGYRGPEKKLAIAFIDNNDTDPNNFTNIDLNPWLNALRAIKTYSNLQPAVVSQVFEKQVNAILSNGTSITIDWSHGLSQARAFKTENSRGPKPKFAADVLAIGDVIRVLEIKNTVIASDLTAINKSIIAISDAELKSAQAAPESQWWLSQTPKAQAALIALDPKDGSILSLIGGFDFQQSHFNRATQAQRQPGSNFKPFVYTAALENGFTPASIINDAPIVFEDRNLESTWRPENDGGKFYGPTRLRQALYRSRNLVSIRILRNVGITRAIKGMSRFGFNEKELPRDLSLALGSHALTPLQIVNGYAVIANGGFQVEPYLINSLVDANGKQFYQATPATACPRCEQDNNELPAKSAETIAAQTSKENRIDFGGELANELAELDNAIAQEIDSPIDQANAPIADEPFIPPAVLAQRVISPQVAFLIDSILKDVIQKGTGKAARILKRNDLAGKTGTTNGPRDAWFSGYNTDIVVTTWLGFDQNSLLGRREYGGSAALPIWIDYMKLALKDLPEKNRPQPNGIVTVRIDPITGERANINTRGAIYESFRIENAPQAISSSSIENNESEDALPEELF